MNRVYAVCVFAFLLVAGCRKPDETEAGKPTRVVKTQQPGKPAIEEKTEKAKPELEKKSEAVPEDSRLKLLEAEYAAYADVVLSHSVAELSEKDRKMLENLLAVAKIIEELHMLQVHPDSLKWYDKIVSQGAEIEKKIFLRYQMPWCGDNESSDCVALAEKPEKRIGQAHWPEGFTDDEYDKLSRQINAKELLSPFTVVRRRENTGYEAIPFAKTELFGPLMAEVAKHLDSAAEFAPDPSLKKFLVSRARAFESQSVFPYDDSDYDWIEIKGDWEVTVGPYETYKDPREQKAFFEMYIGREDKELTGELARFKESLQEMENALGELVGPEIYKSRKLDPRISIRAVDVWMASGEGRRDRGATVAYHLPNRGKAVDEGLYKKVMMVNHSKAFEAVSKARAGLILDKSLLEYVDNRADITNTAFHEFSHGFGAYTELRIADSKGKATTVKQALKEYETILEEAKADVLSLWLVEFQKKKGRLDPQQEKRRYVSALIHALGLLQYPLTGVYPRMVALQLGWYMDNGAVSWDSGKGGFSMDLEKIPAAVESLAKKVAVIQLTGDYAQARELVEKYVAMKGENEYEVVGALAEGRKVMMDKFKEAGIKSPSLRYEVVGWE